MTGGLHTLSPTQAARAERKGRIAGLRAAAREAQKWDKPNRSFLLQSFARWCEREARRLEKEARK